MILHSQQLQESIPLVKVLFVFCMKEVRDFFFTSMTTQK